MSPPVITSWSPSRLEKYGECPMKFRLAVLEKKCGACFKGKLMGGFGKPVICDTCGKEEEVGEALVRGNEMDDNATAYILGKTATLTPDVKRHPKILALLKNLRTEYKAKRIAIKPQHEIVMTAEWQEVGKFTKGAWFRGRMDALIIDGTEARVWDWKSGGIDKNTGKVRSGDKYDDQIFAYNVAVLSTFPQVEKVSSGLAFFDCGPEYDPFVLRPTLDLTRAGLEEAKVTWHSRLQPMFSDRQFSPKPGHYCSWCPYGRQRGGPKSPCRY
jgi:hypothetical protein